MNNEEILQKYGVNKKMGIGIFFQILLLVIGLAITVAGIIRISDPKRVIIYIGQALACIMFIVFGGLKFKNSDNRFFKYTIYSYGFLEALRSTFLGIDGVAPVFGYLARFILIALACNCVVFAERSGKKESLKISFGLLAFEILLCIVYFVGFPGVMLGRINRILPFVGVVIAGSLVLFQKGRIEQMENFNTTATDK